MKKNILIGVCMFLLVIGVGLADPLASYQTNLVARWYFNESSGTTITDFKGSYDLLRYNGALGYGSSTALLDTGMFLNSTGANASYTGTFPKPQDFSFLIWYNFTNNPGGDYLMQYGQVGVTGYYISESGGNLGIRHVGPGSCEFGDRYTDFINNTEYMLFVVANGTELSCYLDNVSKGSVYGARTLPGASTSFMFGNPGAVTEGVILEAVYWENTSFTPSQVNTIYQNYLFGSSLPGTILNQSIIPTPLYINETINGSVQFNYSYLNETYMNLTWYKNGVVNATTNKVCELYNWESSNTGNINVSHIKFDSYEGNYSIYGFVKISGGYDSWDKEYNIIQNWTGKSNISFWYKSNSTSNGIRFNIWDIDGGRILWEDILSTNNNTWERINIDFSSPDVVVQNLNWSNISRIRIQNDGSYPGTYFMFMDDFRLDDVLLDNLEYKCFSDNLITNLTRGDNYTMEVQSWNGSLYTSRNNVSAVVNNYLGTISNVLISPSLAYVNDALNCSFDLSEEIITEENDNYTAYFTWFQNWALNNTFNVTKAVTAGTTIHTDLLVTNLSDTENWTCSVQVYDGHSYSGWTNSSNLTIKETLFDNCSVLTTKGLYITTYDENFPDRQINSTIELEMYYWFANRTRNGTNYISFTNNSNYTLCFKPQDEIAYADMYFSYSNPTGFTHRYYLFNYTLSNATRTLSLYNYNGTSASDLKITLRNSNTYNYYTGIVGILQRKYISEGVWRNVQMDRAGDFGLLHYNILEENTDYRLIFQDSNNDIYKTTNSLKFICTSGLCELTYLLDPYSASSASTNVSVSYIYDNVSNLITINWTDSTGLTSSVRALVTKETLTGTTTICNSTQTGSSGTITCNVTGYSGQLFLRVFNSASPEVATISAWIKTAVSRLASQVGENVGAFWSFAIGVTIALIGSLFGAVGGIIGIIIAMIFIMYIGTISVVNITAVIIISAIGILISSVIKEK